MGTEKKFKLDIFKVLEAVDRGDYSLWSKLTTAEREGFTPLVVMRWLTGTSDERQIMALNTFANKAVFALSRHPELLLKLFTACSSRHPRRYAWLGIKSGGKRRSEATRVAREYLGISTREARELELPAAELLKMAEELGWQKDELARLRRELD